MRRSTVVLLATLALALTSSRGRAEPLVTVRESHAAAFAEWKALAPPGGLAVVRFSAHPDWSAPRGIPPADDAVDASIDRSTVLLAASWRGVARELIWLQPAWAGQLPAGLRRLRVGVAGDRLRVDDPADYWVLDDGWAAGGELSQARAVEARVVPFAGGSAAYPADEWLLDLDLCGFATRNPGADRLRAAGLSEATLERMRRALAPASLALGEGPAARARALAALQRDVGGIGRSARGSLRGLVALWQAGVGSGDLLALGWAFASELHETPPDLGVSAALLVALPEHRATPAEIEARAAELAAWLARAPRPPRAVTVARSLHDGYLPRDVWPAAEASALAALRTAWPALSVRYADGLAPAPSPDEALAVR